MGWAAALNYTWIVMPKPATKSKSAFDTLVDSVTRLRDDAKERMSEAEFNEAEKKFDEVVNRVRASRGRKRETA
jgi:hypothetical protein